MLSISTPASELINYLGFMIQRFCLLLQNTDVYTKLHKSVIYSSIKSEMKATKHASMQHTDGSSSLQNKGLQIL